jgi:acyl-CoA reductase-like NAD-dependent aldehyde dehydrogenase
MPTFEVVINKIKATIESAGRLAVGGYKQSGFGCKTHKVIFDHYRQANNLLVSYSTNVLGPL